jgi:hypothetical protein
MGLEKVQLSTSLGFGGGWSASGPCSFTPEETVPATNLIADYGMQIRPGRCGLNRNRTRTVQSVAMVTPIDCYLPKHEHHIQNSIQSILRTETAKMFILVEIQLIRK